MMKTNRRNRWIRVLLIIVAGLAVACSAFAAKVERPSATAQAYPVGEIPAREFTPPVQAPQERGQTHAARDP